MSKEKILFLLAIAAAVIFVSLLPGVHPYPFSYLLKAIPVLSLSVIIATNKKGAERILILLALLFCLAGDILLDLDRSANLKKALVSFLIGHVFYIVVFLRHRLFVKNRLPWIIGVVIYALVTGYILRNTESSFLIPVMVYLVVITVMTIAAFVKDPFSKITAAGAMVFMVSDTIVAVNRFLSPIPNSTVFNIGLYFLAQILIIWGLTYEKDTV